MGAGLLAVKSGFILFIKVYQFLHNKHALERRDRADTKLGDNMADFAFKAFVSIITSLGYVDNKPC